MDAAYFGLTRNPFERNAGLDEACLPPPLADLVQDLVAGLQLPRTISIVVGDAGAGKSTLASVLASTLGRDTAVAQTTALRGDLNDVLRRVFEQVEPRLTRDGGFVPSLEALARSTANRLETGISTVVILDDAHLLRFDEIESLCRNAHAHVVLFGRPELLEKLGGVLDPNAGSETPIDPVRVRSVKPLTRGFALGYLADRVAAAGGRVGSLFTPSALSRIVDATGGFVTRLEEVSAACLDEAQVSGQHEVGIDLVERVLPDAVSEPPGETTTEAQVPPRGDRLGAPELPAPVPITRAIPPHAPPAVEARSQGAETQRAREVPSPSDEGERPPTPMPPDEVPIPVAASGSTGPEPPGGAESIHDDFLRFSDHRHRKPLHIAREWWLGGLAVLIAAVAWVGFSSWSERQGPGTSASLPGLPPPSLDPVPVDSIAAGALSAMNPPGTTLARRETAGPPAGDGLPQPNADAVTRPGTVARPDRGTRSGTATPPDGAAPPGTITRPDPGTRPPAGQPPKAEPRPETDIRGRWVVQVGAFRSRRNAEGVLVKLRQVDPAATIRERGGLHVVITRSFPSQAEAMAFGTRVQAKGFSAFARRWVDGN